MGASLTFKNHFGSINDPIKLHDYIGLDKPYYSPNYSTYVDLYMNANIGGKTIRSATVGGNGSNERTPSTM